MWLLTMWGLFYLPNHPVLVQDYSPALNLNSCSLYAAFHAAFMQQL
jgi:hypothetical protein